MKKKKNKELTETPLSFAEEVNNIENAEAIKKERHKKSRGFEILRFIIVGIICTIIDFAVQFSLMKWAFPALVAKGAWGEYLSWAISVTVAFLVANFVNFFFSRLWVYQNVDKNINTKSAKAFFFYLLLGVGGWLVGLALQEIGVLIVNLSWPELALSYDFTKVTIGELFQEGGLAFWAFFLIFVIKTCVTMVYNYLTRKFLIFKEPKKEVAPYEKPSAGASFVVTTKEVPAEPVVEKPHYTTKESFKKILHEETSHFFSESQQKVYDTDARRLVREELSKFDDERRARQAAQNAAKAESK